MISVIVPVYQVKDYLETCLQSLIHQSYKDFEILLVDDASTDGSFKICEQYFRKYKNIRVFQHERNCGLGEARNTGIKHAYGEYIYFMDADDAIFPYALEQLHTVALKTGADIVHSAGLYQPVNNLFKIGEKTKLTAVGEKDTEEGFLPKDLEERIKFEFIEDHFLQAVWLNLYKKSFLMENNLEFTGMPICEDLPFAIMSLCMTDKIYRIRKPFYVYRNRKGSLTHSSYIKEFVASKMSLQIGVSYLKYMFKTLFYDSYQGQGKKIDKQDEQEYNEFVSSILDAFLKKIFEGHIYPYFDIIGVEKQEDAYRMINDIVRRG